MRTSLIRGVAYALLALAAVALCGCGGAEKGYGTRVTFDLPSDKPVSREKIAALSKYLSLRANALLEMEGARVDSVTDDSVVLLLPGRKVAAKQMEKLLSGAGLEFYHLGNVATRKHPNRPWRVKTPSGPDDAYLFTGPKAARVDSIDDAADVLPVVVGAPRVKPIITGDQVLPTASVIEARGNAVTVEFTPKGAKRFHEFTRDNPGEYLAVFYNGALICAPVVNEPIEGGAAVVTGFRSIVAARGAVMEINAGTLPVPVKISKIEHYGPKGRD